MNAFLKVITLYVDLPLKQRLQANRQFNQAVMQDRLFVVEKDGNAIGFFTWEKQEGDIFINNLFILPTMRSKENLLYARKIFRLKFPDTQKFYWKNRKHNREMIVRGKMLNNCLVKELARVNKKTVLEISKLFSGLFTKDGLLPLKQAVERAKEFSFDGIRFVMTGRNWHANEDHGGCISDIDFDDLALVGDMGGDSQTTETAQSTTASNQYTKEQQDMLKNILNSSSGTVSTLGTGLNDLLSKSLSGELTDASKSQLRTSKEENASSYGNAATSASEALAGRGMLNSGITNKIMSNLQTGEAKANQSSLNTILSNQDTNMYKTIASALGLSNLAGNLATSPIGQTSRSEGTQQTTADTGTSDTMNAITTAATLAILMCLPKDTKIETENGEVNVQDIKAGDVVKGGRVIRVHSLYVGEGHKFYKFTFKDGKEVVASKTHPFFDVPEKVEEYSTGEVTYDILTESGHYYINGVDVASTLQEVR